MEVDPRVLSSLEHLQKAGLEVIAAMRNALEVAEDLLGDPRAVQVLLADVVETAKTQAASFAAAGPPSGPESDSTAAPERMQRIRLDDD